MTPRRTKSKPPASEIPTSPAKKFPPELRAGDVIVDEHDDAWELLGRPTKVVGAQDLVTTMRRVDRPAEIREGRWKAHQRVRVRRA
jgi:hypothetical protein